jgi:hypothetical protein
MKMQTIRGLSCAIGVSMALAIPLEADVATVITVQSGRDPDDSLSYTCLSNPDGLSTLRRAIVQARNTAAPVEIRFDIPATAEEGYDAQLGIWRLQLFNTTRTQVFRQLTGNITIDGGSQPGGRTVGPKIVIIGPGSGMKEGLILGENALQHQNVVRSLAFQNLRTAIYVNSDDNLIENCWFGLDDAGIRPMLRNNNPQEGSGSDGVALLAGADRNEIRNNCFLGMNGVAAALRGTANHFHHNFVGTRADGTVTEKVTDPALIGSPVDWLGGSGISVSDSDNVIEDNVIAGVRIQISQWSLQADAIRVSGIRHVIRRNRIGLDGNNATIGVCGRGIYLSDGPKNLLIEGNRIIQPELSAISLNGILYDSNTLRGNVIRKSRAWPEVEGMANPENAIQVGKSLPLSFLNFKPARVTSIHGTVVTGTSGVDSFCPNGVIELFLDTGNPVEARESLAVVTADAQGNWTATLPRALAAGDGIRTTSTTAQWGTITNMGAGTTTGLSEFYPPTAPEIAVEQPVKKGLVDGKSKRAFGIVKVGKAGLAKSFTIRNVGTANLSGIKVTGVGKHAKDFVIGKAGKKLLLPGASTTFKVVFKPQAKGIRKAEIRISSNDTNENPFNIAISGQGVRP